MHSNGACMESTGTPASTVSMLRFARYMANRAAAAALIDLAKLTGLPDNTRLVKDAADARHQLSGCIRGAGLAACARVLDECEAAVCARIVALLETSG